MPPVHPARTRRPKAPNWTVEVKGRNTYETKGSGEYASKDTVVARGTDLELVLTDEDGNVYDATLRAAERVNWYNLKARGRGSNYQYTWADLKKKSRCYANVSSDVEMLFAVPSPEVGDFPELDLRGRGRKEDGSFERMLDEPSIYTSRGDFPEVDKAFDAHNGSVIATERMFLKWLMPLLDEKLAAARFDFSNYAGCSCPCSPGFVVSNVRTDAVDYYFSVCSRDETIVTKERIAEADRARAKEKLKEKEKEAAKMRKDLAALERQLAKA